MAFISLCEDKIKIQQSQELAVYNILFLVQITITFGMKVNTDVNGDVA